MIKKFLTAYKDLRLLQENFNKLSDDNFKLRQEIYRLENRSIFDIIKECLDKDLSWYDYSELKTQDKQTYYNQAKQILRTHVFNNELNFLKSNWGKRALLEAESMERNKVAEHIQKMAWMLLGIEQLKIRLETIPNPFPQEQTKENIHSSV